MYNIPQYTQYQGETKIALLDNSTISFMEQIEHQGIPAKELMRDYDMILIPNWVLEEVKDSEYRSRYLEQLNAEGFPIYKIAEESYADLAAAEEGNLYKIVLASVSFLGILKSYLRRNVEKEDILDMDEYADWISKMYKKWPMTKTDVETGRTKKKNAGETQDRDSYVYQGHAHKLLKEEFQNKSPIEISYKSNDFILYQIYRSSIIDLEKVKEIRKDERTVMYTQKRPDQSVVLVSRRLDNDEFIELLGDESVQIIF